MRRLIAKATCAVIGATMLAGCHLDMWQQRRYEALEKGTFFGPGESSSRTPVDGTVAYKMPKTDSHYYQGRVNGELVDELPQQVTAKWNMEQIVQRGHDRFNIYCAPCHGLTGHADGMVVQRGFPQPTSYMDQRLLEAPVGYFFDVMTNGFGRMYSYASRIPVDDRWAIATYVRTIQLSQNATPELLPADVLEQARKPQPGQEAADANAGGAAHVQ
jgi:mono/diheme cytochrome c family protein